MEQQPDRLVAFLDELHTRLGASRDAGDPDGELQALIDAATERNLTTGELVAPDVVVDDERELTDAEQHASVLHSWAFALTGAASNARRAVSQIGGHDYLQHRHPGYVDELVTEVADRLAREQAP